MAPLLLALALQSMTGTLATEALFAPQNDFSVFNLGCQYFFNEDFSQTASVSNTGEGWLSIVAILVILAIVCLRKED